MAGKRLEFIYVSSGWRGKLAAREVWRERVHCGKKGTAADGISGVRS
jgi:hypothetical protein